MWRFSRRSAVGSSDLLDVWRRPRMQRNKNAMTTKTRPYRRALAATPNANTIQKRAGFVFGSRIKNALAGQRYTRTDGTTRPNPARVRIMPINQEAKQTPTPTPTPRAKGTKLRVIAV